MTVNGNFAASCERARFYQEILKRRLTHDDYALIRQKTIYDQEFFKHRLTHGGYAVIRERARYDQELVKHRLTHDDHALLRRKEIYDEELLKHRLTHEKHLCWSEKSRLKQIAKLEKSLQGRHELRRLRRAAEELDLRRNWPGILRIYDKAVRKAEPGS